MTPPTLCGCFSAQNWSARDGLYSVQMATSRATERQSWSLVSAPGQDPAVLTLTVNSRNRRFFFSRRSINRFASVVLLHLMKDEPDFSPWSVKIKYHVGGKLWKKLGVLTDPLFIKRFRRTVKAPESRNEKYIIKVIRIPSREHDRRLLAHEKDRSAAARLDMPLCTHDAKTKETILSVGEPEAVYS